MYLFPTLIQVRGLEDLGWGSGTQIAASLFANSRLIDYEMAYLRRPIATGTRWRFWKYESHIPSDPDMSKNFPRPMLRIRIHAQ